MSWITGWVNVVGWVALVATNALLSSQLIVGIVHATSGYNVSNWQQFLIYIAFTLVAFLLNAFMNSLLPRIYKGALFWSLGGFAIVSITALACASPNYSSARFVFTEFINHTGWPDGVAWLLGLLQGGLGLTAFDSVAHMIEEIPQASKKGPKIMVGCVAIGISTGFLFLIVLLLVAGDIQQVIDSGAGPLLQILINATNSTAGAICLLIFPLVCLAFATISVMTTSSRMIFAFARDGGLPASKFLARVHPQLGLPLNALMLTSVVVVIFGVINIASTNAFNAIISAAVVTLDLSYAMPIAVNCLQGRKTLPDRHWKLPAWLGWTCDTIALSYIAITTVLFVFPPERHVTGSNMNYCIVAFAIILAISIFQWVVDGRKNYTGPRIDAAVVGGALFPSWKRTPHRQRQRKTSREEAKPIISFCIRSSGCQNTTLGIYFPCFYWEWRHYRANQEGIRCIADLQSDRQPKDVHPNRLGNRIFSSFFASNFRVGYTSPIIL